MLVSAWKLPSSLTNVDTDVHYNATNIDMTKPFLQGDSTCGR